MKIIKDGILPEEEKIESKCSRCKCIFIFEKQEGRMVYDQRGDYIIVECPYCDADVYEYL